jgi:hypothetical protein
MSGGHPRRIGRCARFGSVGGQFRNRRKPYRQNAALEADYEALLRDYMSSVGYRYGNLFYRDRIAEHVAIDLQLIANGEQHIQRRDDLAEVTKWVEEYTLRLRAA